MTMEEGILFGKRINGSGRGTRKHYGVNMIKNKLYMLENATVKSTVTYN